MNIFILDNDPVVAAQLQCNKHVVKMILESAQMLATIARKQGIESKYKSTHANHPCTLWAGKTKGNYKWLVNHATALCNEYTYRYGKVHKSQEVIEQLSDVSIAEGALTNFALCMPDEFKVNDPVESYRKYYNSKTFAKWTKREAPSWYLQKVQ